jgi:hypothetical protein
MKKNIGLVFFVAVLMVIGSSSYVFGDFVPAGACCQETTSVCTDNVIELNCGAPGNTWHLGTSCADITPPCGTSPTTTQPGGGPEIPEFPTAALPVGVAALGYLAIRRYRNKE